MLAFAPPAALRGRTALATKYVCDAIGDSHTFNSTWNTLPDFHPFLVQTEMQRRGCSIAITNSGVSGDSTAQILTRARLLPQAQSGSLAVIYGGTNDWNGKSTVQASPSPTTTTFSVAAGKGVYYKANTSILLNGVTQTVQSVSTDSITLSAALASPPTAGQVVMPDTTTNLVATAAQMASLGYTRQIVGRQHYLNFSSAGDTLDTPDSNGVAIRAAQDAAIAAISGAQTADFYTYMRNLIVAGTYAQGDHLWHVADQNSHLNTIGEAILAAVIIAAIPDSWLAAWRV